MDSHVIRVSDRQVVGIRAAFHAFEQEYRRGIVAGLDLADEGFFCPFCGEIDLCGDLFCLAVPVFSIRIVRSNGVFFGKGEGLVSTETIPSSAFPFTITSILEGCVTGFPSMVVYFIVTGTRIRPGGVCLSERRTTSTVFWSLALRTTDIARYRYTRCNVWYSRSRFSG